MNDLTFTRGGFLFGSHTELCNVLVFITCQHVCVTTCMLHVCEKKTTARETTCCHILIPAATLQKTGSSHYSWLQAPSKCVTHMTIFNHFALVGGDNGILVMFLPLPKLGQTCINNEKNNTIQHSSNLHTVCRKTDNTTETHMPHWPFSLLKKKWRPTKISLY